MTSELEHLLQKTIERQAIEIQQLRAAIASVEFLINNSDGVHGLHRNGQLCTWSDLREGGRYEEWLSDFDAVLER